MSGWALTTLCATAGFAVGWLHFRSLRWLAARIVGGDPTAAALQWARLAAVAAFLYFCARGGAAPLLAAAAGLWVGRALALAQGRRA